MDLEMDVIAVNLHASTITYAGTDVYDVRANDDGGFNLYDHGGKNILATQTQTPPSCRRQPAQPRLVPAAVGRLVREMGDTVVALRISSTIRSARSALSRHRATSPPAEPSQ